MHLVESEKNIKILKKINDKNNKQEKLTIKKTLFNKPKKEDSYLFVNNKGVLLEYPRELISNYAL